MPTELIKLLPDGATSIAIIAVVILFLKQQDKSTEYIKELNTQFQETMKLMQAQNQAQVAAMLQGHLQVTQEVIETVQELKATILAPRSRGRPDANESQQAPRK